MKWNRRPIEDLRTMDRLFGTAEREAALTGERKPVPSNRPMEFGASARTVFPRVVELVKADRSRIYGAYVVLAASGLEHGTTARAFAKMHVDRGGLAAAARSEIDRLNGEPGS